MKWQGVDSISSSPVALFERENPRRLQSSLGARMGRRTGGRASTSIRGNWPRVPYAAILRYSQQWPFTAHGNHPEQTPRPTRRRSLQTAASLNASIPEKNEKCWARAGCSCRRSRLRRLSKYTRKFGVLADRRPHAVGGSVLWAYNEGGLLGVVGVFWGNFNVYSVKTRAAEGSRCLCK